MVCLDFLYYSQTSIFNPTILDSVSIINKIRNTVRFSIVNEKLNCLIREIKNFKTLLFFFPIRFQFHTKEEERRFIINVTISGGFSPHIKKYTKIELAFFFCVKRDTQLKKEPHGWRNEANKGRSRSLLKRVTKRRGSIAPFGNSGRECRAASPREKKIRMNRWIRAVGRLFGHSQVYRDRH
jgi:hypothetical protein